MLNRHGYVTQGSGENIFAVRGDKISTPPAGAGLLEGVTRNTVLHIAAAIGHQVIEHNLARSDLYLADEAFFTGTAAEVVPIREIDDHVIGEPGPVTRAIQQKFRAVIEGRDEEFAHYLEYVKE